MVKRIYFPLSPIIFFTGFPTTMEDDEMEDTMGRTSEELREQHLKNPASYQRDSLMASLLNLQDPDGEGSEEVQDDTKAEIWHLLPHLQGVPEATLRKLPISAIFQLNNALAKSSEVAEKLSINSKMAHNA